MKMGMILTLLSILTAIAVGAVLKLTGEIFIPLVVAWFLTQISKPILKVGQKLRLPHVLNVLLVFCVFFVLSVYSIKFCTSQIVSSERLINFYGPKLNELIYKILDALEIPSEAFSVVGLLRRYSRGISGGILNFSSQLVITLIFLLFMLLEAPLWSKKVDEAFPDSSAAKIKLAMASISLQTSRYLGTMTLVSFITAFCVWGTLALIGVEFAVGWGVMAFFLNFIPIVGPFIATIPPVLMAMLQFSPTSGQTIMTFLALGTVQIITGNILAPKMFGNSLGLSPVVVLLSLLLWTMILGIPGAILSVPIASIIKIICENVPMLAPVAVLMGTGQETAGDGEQA